MNILFIANVNSVHTQRYVKDFASKGYNVCIISIDLKNRTSSEVNATIINYGFFSKLPFPIDFIKFVRFLFYSVFINKIIKKHKIGGVIAINLAFGGSIASHISSKIKKIGITLGDEFKPYKWYNPNFIFINKTTIKKTISKLDYIITGDEECFKPIFEKSGWYFKNKFLFFGTILGVDVDKFTPANKNPNLKMELFKIDAEAILALCFREPRPQFDFENILKAVSKLVKKYKNFYFAIGKGNVDCTDLINLSNKLHIAENVIFFEHITYDDLGKYIAQGDIFIDPINLKKNSLFINSGVSQALIESMACGLIPVISNRPSIRWILPPEAYPFIYDDFENDLPLAIEKAIAEKDNIKIKLALRNAIIEKADEEKIIETIINLLGENTFDQK